MAPLRDGGPSGGSSSKGGSSSSSSIGLGRELVQRIQSSTPLLLATTSATSLAFCYLLFPLSTKAFFNRLLTGASSRGSQDNDDDNDDDDDDADDEGQKGNTKRSKNAKNSSSSKGTLKSKRSYASRSSDEQSDSFPAYPPLSHNPAFQPSTTKGRVAVYWDVDNCMVPTGMSGRDVALAIRKAIQDLSPPGVSEPIIVFKAYLELSSETAVPAAQVQLRSELQGSGVSLIDTPKSGRKQTADFMMISDLLAFAIDHPAPARIVLISGDRDFAYALGTLRNRGFFITLMTPPAHVAPILEASAHVVLRWRQDVLGVDYDKDGKPYTGARALKPGIAPAAIPATPSRTSAKLAADPSNSTPRKAGPTQSSAPPGPNNKPIPDVFKPLVDLLEQMRKQGQTRPLRSGVAAQLKQIDKDLYERAGASRWAEYAAVAEAAGIITLGSTGVSGHEWVSLAGLEDDGAYNKPSTGSAGPPASPSISKARAAAALGPNGTGAGKNGNNLTGPQTQTKAAGAASIYQSATAPSGPSNTYNKDNSKIIDSPELRPFLPLIELMNSQRSVGIPYPKLSYIAKTFDRMIKQGVCDAYRQAGVSDFMQYLAAAERAGVAREQYEAIKLHPRYIGVQTTAVTPAVGRMEDTAVVPDKPAAANGKTLFVAPSAMGALNKANVLAANIKTKIAASISLSSPTAKASEDEIRQALYQGLIECLREQRAQKHYYSADFFVQLVLARLPGGESFGRNVDLFNVFLNQAERDGIILLEPGFGGQGRRHIRLAPRHFEREHAAERMGGDTLPVAGFELPAQQGPRVLGEGGDEEEGAENTGYGSRPGDADNKSSTTDDEDVRSLVPPALLRGMLPAMPSGSVPASTSATTGLKTSQPPSRSGSSSGAGSVVENGHSSSKWAPAPAQLESTPQPTGPPTAPASERARYKPLVDSLVHLRREYQIVYPSMEQLYAELRERVTATPSLVSPAELRWLGLPSSSNGGKDAPKPNPHSIDFVQWLSHAADLGLIVIERYTDEAEGQVNKARLRLADRYVEMFKLD
ncbi:hypothetical protein OC842_005218 [Tilletia horrida]|uniref:NYN domain-containing protein n=1 Tax=Tilletia horrida TaxID=155126 RepID=A0AAN6GAI9_9BASI|nr:hypothetical protein OC842_005218 [Tilletia horrida]